MSEIDRAPGMSHEDRERLPDDALRMLDHHADFPAMQRAQSPTIFRRLARITGVLLALYILVIVSVPWQQFVRGSGRVIAWDPLERPLVLEAPLSGRIDVSFVQDGQTVQAGDPLFVMSDNDPNLRANLDAQRTAAEVKLEAANGKLELARTELRQKEAALPEAIASADEKVLAAEVKARTAEINFVRIEGLYRNDVGQLVSQREYELAVLERDETGAALRQARADRRKVELDGRADIAAKQSAIEVARGDSASAAQSLASIRSSLASAGSLEVRAPRDGVVQRVLASQGSFLSAGDPIATLVPATEERRVELWMDGNDIPLVRERIVDEEGRVVQEGSRVRLQFEGWPAVQFIGWPSVARGTFGGEVVMIDPTDDGTGRFRVMIAPRPDVVNDGAEVVEWPGGRWLRQGAQANGWVLLNQVPLWYEIWRQLNGFPPTLQEGPGSTTAAPR